jgi:hypothetical protein
MHEQAIAAFFGFNEMPLVSISDGQRAPPGLAFLGRISPEKGNSRGDDTLLGEPDASRARWSRSHTAGDRS